MVETKLRGWFHSWRVGVFVRAILTGGDNTAA
jgi:hypothetical protein